MGWVDVDGYFEPDGMPFDPPTDSFERAYNTRIAEVGPETVFDPNHGWPVSMRNYRSLPTQPVLRSMLNQFFDPSFRERCEDAGNLPNELDELAIRLLRFAIELDSPITDRERVVGTQLGLAVNGLPRTLEFQ